MNTIQQPAQTVKLVTHSDYQDNLIATMLIGTRKDVEEAKKALSNKRNKIIAKYDQLIAEATSKHDYIIANSYRRALIQFKINISIFNKNLCLA